MPRKKSSKRSPQMPAKKRENSTSSVLAHVSHAEKQMLILPEKLAKQLAKEINAQKKKEKKLEKISAKQKKLIKNTELRMATLVNGKATPTTKKKVSKSEKLIKLATRLLNENDHQLQITMDNLAKLAEQQTRMLSFSKYLGQFDKKPKVVTKAKRKLKSVTGKAATTVQADQTIGTEFDQLGFDEVTELAS